MLRSFAIPFLALALTAGGCATVPETNAQLARARADYRSAAADPQVTKFAPLELKEAERALQRAEGLRNEDADAERVEHQAYLASQRAHIAEETAAQRAAHDRVEQAQSARQAALMQERNREVEQARRARAAQANVIAAATMRAEKLEDRVAQLQGALEQAQMRHTDRGYVLTLGADVLFDFDEAVLKPGAERTIEKIADFLREDPRRYIAIEGFTDNVGTNDYNLDLSQRRARAVKDALVARGIDRTRIQTRGFGEAYPVATNATPTGRQLNRRVEIVVGSGRGPVARRQP